jgi:hypothetical protein
VDMMAESEMEHADLCTYFQHLKGKPDEINLYKEKLYHFFKWKMEGEKFYIGKSMEEAHQGLGITDDIFDKSN